MKMSLLFLLLFFVHNSYANLDLRDKEIDFLKCIKKISKHRRLNESSIQNLYQLITSYKETNIDLLNNQCNEYRKESKEISKISNDEILKIFKSSPMENKYAKKLLMDIIIPKHECKFGGAQVDLGFAYVIGAGFGVGVCKGSDGRKWLSSLPIVSAGFGIEVAVMGIGGTLYFDHGELIFDWDEQLDFGLLLMFKGGAGSQEISGAGVGAGFKYGDTKGAMIKMIPLSVSYEEQLSYLHSSVVNRD